MDLVQLLLVVVLVAAVVAVVSAPLRAPGRDRAGAGTREALAGERAALEAAREAKYREIREAELDVRTGKLAREDWEAIDRQLRAEAMDVLRALDRLPAEPGPGSGS